MGDPISGSLEYLLKGSPGAAASAGCSSSDDLAKSTANQTTVSIWATKRKRRMLGRKQSGQCQVTQGGQKCMFHKRVTAVDLAQAQARLYRIRDRRHVHVLTVFHALSLEKESSMCTLSWLHLQEGCDSAPTNRRTKRWQWYNTGKEGGGEKRKRKEKVRVWKQKAVRKRLKQRTDATHVNDRCSGTWPIHAIDSFKKKKKKTKRTTKCKLLTIADIKRAPGSFGLRTIRPVIKFCTGKRARTRSHTQGGGQRG